MRKTLLVALSAALALSVGLAAPAQATTKSRCLDHESVNLRLCATLNYSDGDIWASGTGTEIVDTAFGEYTVRGDLQRRRCGETEWQVIGTGRASGNDRIRVITPVFRHQAGFQYRAVTLSNQGFRFGVTISPALSRC